jgi:hypothetical protein
VELRGAVISGARRFDMSLVSGGKPPPSLDPTHVLQTLAAGTKLFPGIDRRCSDAACE